MGDNYFVKVERGVAKLYKTNGLMVRTLCEDAVSGIVAGDEAMITLEDGHVKIYSVNGYLIRTE